MCQIRLIKISRKFWLYLILLIVSGNAIFYSLAAQNVNTAKMEFWKTQRKGANGGLLTFRPEWFKAAAGFGIEYIRFHPDVLPADERDFLIGDADDFQALNSTDLQLLKKFLDEAESNNLKIVLTMFSLPGCRWRQLNGDVDDYRIWQNAAFQAQAFKFWHDLAAALKDHPAIVAYNPLNEPHPEKAFGFERADSAFAEWVARSKNTRADLNRFNRQMVAAIRAADKTTPILLDGYFYADTQGFPYLEPVDDPFTLYAFHNIAPWQFAAFRANKGRYEYPGRMPENWNGPGVPWSSNNLERRVQPVREFMKKYQIPAERIIASELWCDRRVAGCKEYLADAITIYNRQGWHWVFYSFRSDGQWGGLDYELGTEPKLGWKYWKAVEKGIDAEPFKKRGDNPIWNVLKKEFRRGGN